MNQAEYEALSDNCLPPFAVTLYIRCFRKKMRYSDGIVHVSLRSMKEEMEHTPLRGSNTVEPKPTTEKIRTAVRQLERANLIELIRKGSIKEQKAACYHCSLASTDLSGSNEEQHESNTGTTRNKKTPQPTPHKRYSGNVLKFQKSDEQHISVISDIEEEDSACARENLNFCNDWIGLAKQVGLSVSTDELQAIFNKWKFSDTGNTYRHIATHRKYWMRYCATIKHNQVKGGSHALKQQSSQQSGYRNATATAWRDCYERAQRGEGVEAFDFSTEQT